MMDYYKSEKAYYPRRNERKIVNILVFGLVIAIILTMYFTNSASNYQNAANTISNKYSRLVLERKQEAKEHQVLFLKLKDSSNIIANLKGQIANLKIIESKHKELQKEFQSNVQSLRECESELTDAIKQKKSLTIDVTVCEAKYSNEKNALVSMQLAMKNMNVSYAEQVHSLENQIDNQAEELVSFQKLRQMLREDQLPNIQGSQSRNQVVSEVTQGNSLKSNSKVAHRVARLNGTKQEFPDLQRKLSQHFLAAQQLYQNNQKNQPQGSVTSNLHTSTNQNDQHKALFANKPNEYVNKVPSRKVTAPVKLLQAAQSLGTPVAREVFGGINKMQSQQIPLINKLQESVNRRIAIDYLTNSNLSQSFGKSRPEKVSIANETELQQIPAANQSSKDETQFQQIPASNQSNKDETQFQQIPAANQSSKDETQFQQIPAANQSSKDETQFQQIPASNQSNKDETQFQQIPASNQSNKDETRPQNVSLAGQPSKDSDKAESRNLSPGVESRGNAGEIHPLNAPERNKLLEDTHRTQIENRKVPNAGQLDEDNGKQQSLDFPVRYKLLNTIQLPKIPAENQSNKDTYRAKIEKVPNAGQLDKDNAEH